MPTECPVTGGPLLVTRLECEESGVKIEGRFEPNEFAVLPQENLDFLRLYVKVRGNLKEVERILGVSYPTVRLRLEKLLLALGYEVGSDPAEERADARSAREARSTLRRPPNGFNAHAARLTRALLASPSRRRVSLRHTVPRRPHCRRNF